MKYRVTVLTPTLVGNGDKLSPIDYMVWRDQVNVLDQTRIFKLLSKGPRLEGYLDPVAQSDEARLRFVGRLRPELCRPPHSVRRRLIRAAIGNAPRRRA